MSEPEEFLKLQDCSLSRIAKKSRVAFFSRRSNVNSHIADYIELLISCEHGICVATKSEASTGPQTHHPSSSSTEMISLKKRVGVWSTTA